MAEDTYVVRDDLLKLPDIKLEDQDVKTGEEDETVMWSHRGKLFRLDRDEWRERALGDAKLLKHKETGVVRLLMRQEKSFKVRANFVVDPNTEIKVHPENPVFALWSALDFSDPEPKAWNFMMRMKTEDNITEFIAAWKKAQEANAGKTQTGSGDAAGAAAAGASAGAADTGLAAKAVPVIASWDEVEDKEADVDDRLDETEAAFSKAFNAAPAFFARAPGRVNLLGEHIDYHSYPVLPAAVSKDVLVAAAVGGSNVKVVNVQGDKFPAGEFDKDATARPEGPVTWVHYVQAGYLAALRLPGAAEKPKPALQMAVSGNVPTAAGMSSSSALVVAAALTTAHAMGLRPTAGDLAAVTATGEQFVGTLSGGMDQAASVMGVAGSLLHVQFKPQLAAHAVALPAGVEIVVAHSGVESAKAETAAARYNKRVVEGVAGAKMIAKKEGLDIGDIDTVAALQAAKGVPGPGDMTVFLGNLNDTYSASEAAAALGVDSVQSAFSEDRADAVAQVVAGGEPWAVKARVQHVLEEAARVSKAVALAKSGGEHVAQELGELMNASHTSCAELYECSCPELDELVSVMRGSGALGARLMGAGWGGCAVALVPKDKTEAVVAAAKEWQAGAGAGENVWVCHPAAGAYIVEDGDICL